MLRARGWHVEIVERWNPHSRTRHDLFGFLDLLCIGPDGLLGVQTTSGTNVAARVRKITDAPLVGLVRDCGIAIHVHGWRKDKAGRWQVREVNVS